MKQNMDLLFRKYAPECEPSIRKLSAIMSYYLQNVFQNTSLPLYYFKCALIHENRKKLNLCAISHIVTTHKQEGALSRGLCPGGIRGYQSRGGLCLGGPCQEDPRTVACLWYASYLNAFLLVLCGYCVTCCHSCFSYFGFKIRWIHLISWIRQILHR